MKERLFEVGLVAVSFGMFAFHPGFPMAMVVTAVIAYVGLIRYLEPPPVKPASEDDLQAFKEKLAGLQGEIGLLRAALGLSSGSRAARPKVTVFKEQQPST